MRIHIRCWPENLPIIEHWYSGQYPRGESYYVINWENIFVSRKQPYPPIREIDDG